MPQCFTLTRKSDPNAGPVAFTQIDAEMCAHFGVPVHKVDWFCYWYPKIMEWGVAFGKSFAQLIEAEEQSPDRNEHHLAILQWLDNNFTSDAWAEVGRH